MVTKRKKTEPLVVILDEDSDRRFDGSNQPVIIPGAKKRKADASVLANKKGPKRGKKSKDNAKDKEKEKMFSGISLLGRNGQRYLLFRLPDDSTQCHLLAVQQSENDSSSEIASCLKCLRIDRLLADYLRRPIERLMVHNCSKLDKDPSKLFHYSECRPLGFDHTLSRYLQKNPLNSHVIMGDVTSVISTKDPSTNNLCTVNAKCNYIGVEHLQPTVDDPNPQVYPIEVLRLQHPSISFLYMFPDDSSKCYRYSINKKSLVCMHIVCAGCYQAYKKIRLHPGLAFETVVNIPTLLHCDGFATDQNPLENHLVGCEAVLTGHVMATYHATGIVSQFERRYQKYPLQPLEKKNTFSYLYRVDEDYCYRFNNLGGLKAGFNVVCCVCVAIQARQNRHSISVDMKDILLTRRVINGCLEKNPNLCHFPNCQPLRYDNVMNKYEHVDDETAARVKARVRGVELLDLASSTANIVSVAPERQMSSKKKSKSVQELQVDGPRSEDSAQPEKASTGQLFTKTFDAYTFTRDEISTKFDGWTLRVKFKREIPTSLGSDAATLRYKTEIPEWVDKDSLEWTWDKRQVCFTGKSI